MRQYRQNTAEGAFSILTLDDDPIMTSTIQAYFQRSGYRVDVENDPQQAIERIRRGHYDILLLDFLMTPICGDQVVEQIRQFNHDIFIILLTGHKSMAPPIKTIRALDIQGYYEKSDRFDQLELLVESCVKSIRQMRTIRSYKDGLSAIMDSLPLIHDLRSMEHITDSILHTASSLLPCANVVLTLDAEHYSPAFPSETGARFSSRAAGDGFSALTSQEAEDLMAQLEGKSSLVLDRQLVLPLVDGEQHQIGLLTILLREPPKYDQIQLMEVFSRQASSAICNARLHALVQEKNHKLDQAYSQLQSGYLEMISTMRRVVDAKDAYTRGHSDRVSFYALQIARKLGRDPAYCERVRVAGLFHDVGKLSIPDDILLKNGKLTAQEYDVIKTHPRNGAELLSVISQFRPILPAILSHHERIDGCGYPDGLQGEDIPEEARIIAVADTFDAMTSDRQYRKSLSFQQAMEELERSKGTQLDAHITEVFQSLALDPEFWTKMREEIQDRAPRQAVPDFSSSTGGPA
ncbi:HD domain-containing response regulator [Pseudoflavonifractor phocaeensis]|uniref:HD domain-containing response regulator n=1 Tax=Pseudoflavonifractor phocaeensis TaxID=1870988 RepID=UPI001F35BC43|nr:HD domain-containing response regulator [Pseudoflavonifractor phocaeensis]MCF2662578.1 HD domain-containing response regulator [Pseudoflavonifractor phocaeensis]